MRRRLDGRKRKLLAATAEPVRALKRVDLPTLGSPTIPDFHIFISSNQEFLRENGILKHIYAMRLAGSFSNTKLRISRE